MTARNEDFLFAQEAQNLGYVTEEQVEEGFLLQRRMAEDLQIDERLAVILVKRSWMAEEQARRVYGIIEPEGARSRIEGYRLVQKIGRGAMGTVYKAIHKGLHRVVAIKILRRDLLADRTQIERLKREATLLADLDHPNIVRAFDAGESNGFPYLVMEYVEGDTLREHIAQRGTLPDEEALRITRALADALEKARRMGIVHRDVKPGNILINKSGTPKLMDLGLAKGPLDPSLTQHGATVGTPQFMSPEQAESPDKADTRSDIYSLGATLYAMVTGRPPFHGSTLAEIITKVMSQQPLPPRVRNPDVSPEVSHLIERMMLKDASLRYATPADVVADIDMIRGGQSIIPRGFQGNWEAYLLRQRFLRWRRRIVVGLATVVVLGVLGSLYWRGRTREDARMEVARLETEVLALGPVRADHELEQMRGLLSKARALQDRIRRVEATHEVAGENTIAIQQAIKQYEHAVDVMARFRGIQDQVVELLGGKRYVQAQEGLRAADSPLMDQVRSVSERLERLRARVQEESDRELQRLVSEAQGVSAPTVAAFVAKWDAYARVFEGDFVHSDALRVGRAIAKVAQDKAHAVAAVVADLQAAWDAERIAPRVAGMDFYALHEDLARAVQAATAAIHAHLEAWPSALTRPGVLQPNGIVTHALNEPARVLRATVQAYAEELFEKARSLAAVEAEARLRAFATAAGRGDYYVDLAARADRLALQLKSEYEALQARTEALYAQLLDGVLGALRDGRPEQIERDIAKALRAEVHLSSARRADLQALRAGAEALRALHKQALAWLGREGSSLSQRDVRLRSTGGTWTHYPSLRIEAVDLEAGTLRVRLPRRGSSRPIESSLRIGEVAPDITRAWAQRAGGALPPGSAALTELGLLPPVSDEPGVDLRRLGARYRAVAERFPLPDFAAWRRLTGAYAARLAELQALREERAQGAIATARYYVDSNKPKLALEFYDRILDEGRDLRWTDAFDKSQVGIEKDRDLCREILAQQEMLRFFHGGVDPRELEDGRHRILFDFDDEGQLRNFERGFGELVAARSAVTPGDPAQAHRLQLLPRVRGVLRDRPLSLENPFDPNEKMVLEVTVDTQKGSTLLAFDLDGVQLALCSADPNWWQRRLPPEVPRVEDEEAPPEFDFYGLGRGLAFHEGEDFGRAFPLGSWDWSPRAAGRDFIRWRDRGYLEKHREELFALEPGRVYAIRIVRVRGELTLYVDGERIVSRTRASWAQRGGYSESEKRMRNGSGRIQILTWTPVAIDDLRLEGKVSERWKERRRRALPGDGADSADGKRPK